MTNRNYARLGSVIATVTALTALMSGPLIASDLNAAAALQITDGSYQANPCSTGASTW
jgi:hypothetical protein